MKKDDDVKLERIFEKQIKLFGKALRVKQLFLISTFALGLAIPGFFFIGGIVCMIFILLSFVLFVFSLLLLYKNILYLGEYCIEVSPLGEIFITKLFGQCTICLGELKIVNSSKGTFIQCKVDQNHIWKVHK